MDFLQKMKAKIFKKRGAKHYPTIFKEASISQIMLIDSLLITSGLTLEYQENFQYKIDCGLTEGEATEIIEYLKDLQDPISYGFYYTQRDFYKKIKSFITNE